MKTTRVIDNGLMPNVSVQIPTIALNISDLAYLRGLVPGNTRCGCGGKTQDKLLFLGLIVKGEIQPTKEQTTAWETEAAEMEKKCKVALRERNWDDLDNLAGKLRYARNKPETKIDFILTASGEALLRTGEAKTKITKSGCA